MAKPSAKSRPKAKAAVRVELVQKPKPKAAGRKCRTCDAPAAVGNYGYCGVHRTSGPGGKTEAAGAEVPTRTQPKSGRRRSAAERQQDENSVVTRSCLGEFAAQALAPAAASMGEACLVPLQRACNTLCQLVVAEALQEAVRQRRKSKPRKNSLRKLEISATPAAAVDTGPLRVNTYDLRAALATMGFVPSPLLMPAPVGEAAAAASRHFPEGVRPDRIRCQPRAATLSRRSARVQQPVCAPVQVRAAQWPGALATVEGGQLPELPEGPGLRTKPIRAVFMI
jgi:hypothetical protein